MLLHGQKGLPSSRRSRCTSVINHIACQPKHLLLYHKVCCSVIVDLQAHEGGKVCTAAMCTSSIVQDLPGESATGNDFSTLYAPLIRDGRMEKFYWAPTREDRVGVATGIFQVSCPCLCRCN